MMHRASGQLHFFILLCTLFTLFASGCAVENHMEKMDSNTERMARELEADREYLQTVSEEMRALSQSLSALQHASEGLFTALAAAMKQPDPGRGIGIDAVLRQMNTASPTESPNAPSETTPLFRDTMNE